MRKVKWIKIESPFPMSVMAEKLAKNPYTEERGKGFLLEKVRKNCLHGRFVEKILYEDNIPSLFGEDTLIERIEYKVTEFSFDEDSYPIAVITNPPRTLRPFANALIKSLGLGVSLEEVIVEPFSWIEKIGEKHSVSVNQIDVSQMQVSEYALAKMQISSTKDLRYYYEKELSEKKIRVDRASLSITMSGTSGRVKIFRNGMANIDIKNEKEVSNMLFETLKLALK
ncbi:MULTISPECIES: hypothetical protein [Serratia]|uniref:hypothetical protein n=2 Tax=Serratia TaxID=613 RepID=UPI0004E2EEE4|nr:hypothetical protein [Serratia marcescens]KKO56317.1 hypothetical protein LG59_724 [Serratia ureilytica]KFB56036.1 hypothetical protein DH21_12730 [Serratia marcescens]MBN5333348.1 hypothetical protein [Serratia marcescens]MBN5337992.1 hypothetical protein [Serratia marcescens]MCW7557279.1 hypothetical protein [Serratia marcescens]